MGTSNHVSGTRSRRGWRLIVVVGALSLLAGVVPAAAGGEPEAAPAEAAPHLAPVFAPDTDPEYAEEVLQSLYGEGGALSQPAIHWDPLFTALNNGGSGQGDSLELTWSVIPDGTLMPKQFPADTACTSDLIATLNALYGPAAWPAEINKVWDEWAGKTGNKYTPAVAPNAAGVPIDDGAAWPGSPGLAGVRGDIRIGGCTIDGDFGILAFNFFPNNGDMKIESMDAFFAAGLSPEFHNTFSHEHGHGAGMEHVCPVDGTKLMEPIIGTGFTGMQPDDILGAQRLYGDRFERINNPNDSQGSATSISPLGGFSRKDLSIDNGTETDWFSFTANAGDTLDVTITPTGSTYPEGPDPVSDLCASASPTPFDSLTEQDLSFEIRNFSGVARDVDDFGAGTAESLFGYPVRSDGTFFVRVLGDGSDNVQMYDIDIERFLGPPNNHFPNPQPFTRIAQKQEVDTTGATVQGGEPSPCGLIGSTVWYKLEPGATMDVVVNTFQADYDTVLAVYTGTALSNLVNVDCNDDFGAGLKSKIAFEALVGETYWIQAGGFLGSTGDLAVKIRSVTPFFCRGGRANILGTAADDVLNGGAGFDRLRGFGGNDVLLGRGGNDKLCGDSGADDLDGGPGTDRVDGGPGPDTCVGEIQFSC